jgi:uncharacterized protein (DUF2461 family)
MAHFTDATFDFLFELDVHNSKEWMDENRHRYESEVKQPMFRFVEALAEPMHKAVSSAMTSARTSPTAARTFATRWRTATSPRPACTSI